MLTLCMNVAVCVAQVCNEYVLKTNGRGGSQEVALSSPAPCSSEATPPPGQKGKGRRLSYDEAKLGTAG